jgi:two-component system chemotaxis response regulator CheY
MPNAMVIDDSKAMRLILSRTLTNLGYDVHAAGNGQLALNYLNEEEPELALILVDWNMPEMNGLEFVKCARAIPRYDSVPLMMVTTETEINQMILALEAGANEYVMKPFTEEMIIDKLKLMGVLQ